MLLVAGVWLALAMGWAVIEFVRQGERAATFAFALLFLCALICVSAGAEQMFGDAYACDRAVAALIEREGLK